MDDRPQAVRRLVAATTRQGISTDAFLRHVCQTATHALSASGVGISVMTDDGTRGVCAASDPISERVEELQFIMGEGPCIDAFTTGRPVLVADLGGGAANRWPGYAPAALQDGVRAVFAFPLQVGAARLGILDVFRQRVGPLTEMELPLALTFADVTVEALLDRQRDAGGVAVDGMAADSVALDVGRRAELFQAQGMVMVQLGVSISEALSRMRAYAYAENRRLDDVARDVVARRLRLDKDHR
ncbi:GAF and ANTAR domain-containing protein [Actinoplanes sp. NPDC051475]|uniref:GAF and ANTAR domain-containing protein n=1 Tax=Actinoplanes sp. NPDC051475 TaxID=3157225 RepID=UPI00344D9FE3